MSTGRQMGTLKVRDIMEKLEEWKQFEYENCPTFACAVDFTKENPSLLSVLLALKIDGYDLEF